MARLQRATSPSRGITSSCPRSMRTSARARSGSSSTTRIPMSSSAGWSVPASPVPVEPEGRDGDRRGACSTWVTAGAGRRAARAAGVSESAPWVVHDLAAKWIW